MGGGIAFAPIMTRAVAVWLAPPSGAWAWWAGALGSIGIRGVAWAVI